jgi:hypothetical protein
MDKYRVTLLVEGKNAEEVGAHVGTLGCPRHDRPEKPLHTETLEIELVPQLDEETAAEMDATHEAILKHIESSREDPVFMARLAKRMKEDALVLEYLGGNATVELAGPRRYFFIVYAENTSDPLTIHTSTDFRYIAQLACETFGGESNGPGSIDEVAHRLTHGRHGCSYSVPELSTYGFGFHSGVVPNEKIVRLVLRCDEVDAARVRALVQRLQTISRSADPAEQSRARSYSIVTQVGSKQADLIPVCIRCLSEDVEEVDNPADTERWLCGNCGARFEHPIEASS